MISATLNARPSPIATACPISGLEALILASMFAGDMFLPAALMISSFTVDDLEVAVLVELAGVAGVEPAVLVDRLTGLVGWLR